MWKCSQTSRRTRCVSIHSLNWQYTNPSRISWSHPAPYWLFWPGHHLRSYSRTTKTTQANTVAVCQTMMNMEVFHTACTMLSITGKRLQYAGLRNLCVESGVIAEGSVAEVLQGRRYNSGVRLHKLVCEALIRLAWQGFRAWIEENYKQSKSIVESLFGEIGDMYDDICKR